MPVDVEAEVLWNKHLSADYNVVALGAPTIARVAEPGQFVMVRPGREGAPLLRRPYSLFEVLRDPSGDAIGFSLLSKRVGASSRLLFEASQGQRIACLGPLGRPFVVVDPPEDAWMVAGGVGLAPFAMLAEALATRGTKATLFYGARGASELFCLDLFERLRVRLVLATEDGSRGAHGRVTAPLEQALGVHRAESRLTVYACGPEPMLKAVAGLAAAHGRPSQLAMERIMGCGMGGCYSCVVRVREPSGRTRYARSCLEGPVLRGEDIVWEE
jgi:dihydroorotate dehydrogenase electron transfer subunit